MTTPLYHLVTNCTSDTIDSGTVVYDWSPAVGLDGSGIQYGPQKRVPVNFLDELRNEIDSWLKGALD